MAQDGKRREIEADPALIKTAAKPTFWLPIFDCQLALTNTSTLCRLQVNLIRSGYVSSNALRIHFGILQAINLVRSSGLSAFLIAEMHSGVEPFLPR